MAIGAAKQPKIGRFWKVIEAKIDVSFVYSFDFLIFFLN